MLRVNNACPRAVKIIDLLNREKSGLNINSNPSFAPGNVSAYIAIMNSIKAKIGIIILFAFSIPFLTPLYGKIAVVIGSEGKGISRLVKENCDFKVFIPMVGHVNSLNASVSASILFYEILRNRG